MGEYQYRSTIEYTSGVVEAIKFTTVIQKMCGCVYVHVYPGSSPHSGESSILQLFLCDLSPLQCSELFFQSDEKMQSSGNDTIVHLIID